jgi:hypothetical protein
MKKFSLIVLILAPLLLSAQSKAEKEINTFLDQWHRDAANADMEAYFSKIDDEGIYIGTDKTEIWTKNEFYEWQKPRTSDGIAWDFKAIDRNIYFGKKSKYVWFDELLSYSAGTLRGSGVLIKRKKGWKIMHYVLSLPVPNEKFSAVIKAMKDDE